MIFVTMFTDGHMVCYGDRCDTLDRCDGLLSWCLRLPVMTISVDFVLFSFKLLFCARS